MDEAKLDKHDRQIRDLILTAQLHQESIRMTAANIDRLEGEIAELGRMQKAAEEREKEAREREREAREREKEAAERQKAADQRMDQLTRNMDLRIGQLVSAIGELIRRMDRAA
jgi:septal ring factor EnvC (AmiA/AmiB activator)